VHVGGSGILDYAAHASRVGRELVGEFPEGVAVEVEAWRVLGKIKGELGMWFWR
jgi:hypothetical protein